MTSNLGSEYILDNEENAHELVMGELRKNFRPEFINRIDEIIVFNPLKKDCVAKILDKIINEINNRLKVKQIKVLLTSEASTKVIDEAFVPEFGARPIKRYVTNNIESLIAHALVGEDIKPNSVLEIDVKDDKFILNIKRA